ncbi:MAG: hypothetical protein IKT52_05500 [Oscillospiraceae bacterium]|nr:hypothetical protein [Oscillospiraceae bacterium]
MKQKIVAILVAFVMAISLGACGAGEETTHTGMVVSVDGTVISLMEMDTSNMGGKDFAEGERPEMQEGFGGFNPDTFDGTLPEGGNFPQWGEGEMPEGMEPPEGMTMPEDGEMPDFGGENGGMRPGFGNFGEDMETKDVDIANAHISVEIDGGKASGSMEDLVPGTFVTITMNGKGEVTNVLVSSQSSFGGRFPSN